MYSYRFNGPIARIFGHLTHGPDVTVQRDGSTVAGEDGEQLDHTVTLEPGDILSVPELQHHAELEPADNATADAHAAEEQAAADEGKLPTRKPELQQLARDRGLDDSGTVADLTARLSA